MEKNNILIHNTSSLYRGLLKKKELKKSSIFSNSIFNHYKKNHFNLLKEDIKKMRLVKKRDMFFNYFYFINSAILLIVFFNLNAINSLFFVISNILFLKFFKIYKYELLIYYKKGHFTKITILNKEVEEVEKSIDNLN